MSETLRNDNNRAIDPFWKAVVCIAAEDERIRSDIGWLTYYELKDVPVAEPFYEHIGWMLELNYGLPEEFHALVYDHFEDTVTEAELLHAL